MKLKSVVENGVSGTLAVCAVFVTVMLARREFFPPPDPNTPQPPQLVKQWESYATGDERIGAARAPVTVVVFSDFQCPFCKQLSASLRSVRSKHPAGDIAIVHRNYPLTRIHPYARPAAVAAQCAARQGRFEQYHDLLFAKQDSLGSVDWWGSAQQVGVADSSAFTLCLQDQAVASALRADSLAAEALRITGTPLVMINGWLFDGTPSEQAIEEVIGKVRESDS